MRTISFPYSFTFDIDEPYNSCFSIELSDKEISDLMQFVKENPGLPFWALDYDFPELFDKMIKAHTAAMISTINEARINRGESPITEGDICWEDVEVFFDWPEVFLQS